LTGEGLVGVETPEWLERRRLAQPAFVQAFHPRYAAEVTRGLGRLSAKWKALAEREEPVSVVGEMSWLTLSNTGRTLFGCDIDDLIEPISREMSFAVFYLSRWHNTPPWKRRFGPYFKSTSHARFRRALATLEEVTEQILARHARSGAGDELLSLILSDDKPTSKKQRARRVRDELLTYLFTGNETTAIALSWCWHLLARSPEHRERLHLELDSVLGERAPELSDLEHLPFTLQIVQESLRIYPPAWQISRQTKQVECLGGYAIPLGAQVIISPYVVHRRANSWDEPEEFRPERFSNESSASRSCFGYIPFGGGPRQCLGARTSMIEAQLALATLARELRLDSCAQRPISMVAGITLVPSDGLPMRLSRRR